jgi:hypothetical protein
LGEGGDDPAVLPVGLLKRAHPIVQLIYQFAPSLNLSLRVNGVRVAVRVDVHPHVHPPVLPLL